jgi:hypothetical protein
MCAQLIIYLHFNKKEPFLMKKKFLEQFLLKVGLHGASWGWLDVAFKLSIVYFLFLLD